MTNDERDNYIIETHTNVASMKATMDAHTANEVIHQVPPCKAHEVLSKRIWGVGMLSLSTAIGLAIKWLTTK